MSRTAQIVLAASAAGLLVLACAHQAPAPVAPPAQAIQVPPGCEQSLAGRYRHARDPAFVYQGADDGGTLVLALHRSDTPPTDAGWARTQIVLTRTPKGFRGETRTTAYNALHQPCAVSLPTSVLACDDAGVTLLSAQKVAIDPTCQPSAAPPEMAEQRLLRLTDGGL
jgi:hypothetical protein